MPKKQGKKVSKTGLGSALQKSRNRKVVEKRQYIEKNLAEQKPEAGVAKVLESVLERDTLKDFLYNAEIQQQKFEAVRAPRLLVEDLDKRQIVIDHNSQVVEDTRKEQFEKALEEIGKMRIPRKPQWDGVRVGDEQKLAENIAFTAWRRKLAEMQEKYRIVELTPYEKNVELWKQLWRVVEKSDVVIQIVDGRDPLFFRCQDLEVYCKEIDPKKLNMLLINKADLMDEEVRQKWSTYFNENKIDHIFFSAKMEQQEINEDPEAEEEGMHTENTLVIDSVDDFRNTSRIVKMKELKALMSKIVNDTKEKKKTDAPTPDYNPEEELGLKKALEILRKEQEDDVPKIFEGQEEPDEEAVQQCEARKRGRMVQMKALGKRLITCLEIRANLTHPDLVTIGMVGFPNVGKSSVINVLCGKKLVGVDARPGKTKNFQTIFLEKNLLLCDCPGLVFPSIVFSKAEMICNGVVPLANLREYMPAMKYLADKIPRVVFEYKFKFTCPGEEEYAEPGKILHYFAVSRGMIRQGSGTPDYHNSAVFMLRRLVEGSLLLCKLPGENNYKTELPPANFKPSFSMNPNITSNKGQVYENYENTNKNTEANFFNEIQDEEEKIDVSEFDQQDVMDLVTGKLVNGIKLDKNKRREIKFAIKRDAESEEIFMMLDKFINGEKTRGLNEKKKGTKKQTYY